MKQQLTISQILLYYDLPQILVVKNAVETKFLALLVNVNNQETRYISTAISNRRLSDLINGAIDLRDIFEKPEINQFFSFDYIDEQIEAEAWSTEAIPSEFLPDAGFIFDKKTDDIEIIQESLQKNNAIIHISLSDKSQDNSIMADNLGDILKYYQLTIENTFKKSISQSPDRIQYSKPANYKLRAFAASPGSFKLHLFSTAQVNLFGGSIIEIALKKFDELVSNKLTDEELLIVLRSVKGHTISSLKNLLSKVISLDISIKHRWYAPDQVEVHSNFIDKSKAERITTILNSAEELTEEIKVFQGHLAQVDIDRGTWRIFNTEDNKEYSGICENLSELQGVTVETVVYKLICKEIIEELKVSEKEKIKFVLISIDEVSQ